MTRSNGRYPVSLRTQPTDPGRPARLRQRRSADGQSSITFLSTRLLPARDRLISDRTYAVQAGDRPDLIASRLLGDPLQYWRIADANNVPNPLDLTTQPGTRLMVPAPLADAGDDGFHEPRVSGTTANIPAIASIEHDDDDGPP